MMIIVVVLLIQQLKKRMMKHPMYMIVKDQMIILNPNIHQEHLMTGANLPNLQLTLVSIVAKWVTLPQTVQDPSKVGIMSVQSARRFLRMIRIQMTMQVVRMIHHPIRKMDMIHMNCIKVVMLKRSK